ncbi:TIR domain-containing protein [Neoaquamicrobium sediminum]|uniref:TIR domain-containing protein n=1 Tax=Neoaquamicrobium sediminum TaxID=1849104 RepID=UPI001FCFCA31|nr:TIR domain-containing protein [Mesorhizobium sediminum]
MNEVNLLRAHAKNENSDIEFNDHSVREPYDSERAEYIKKKISERISRSSICVVYISDNTAQSRWVTWEVETSLALGKR